MMIKLPPELSSILEIHLRVGHPVLCQAAGASHFQYVFLDRQGRHMAGSQSMTQFWQGLLQEAHCRIIFPPHRYILCVTVPPHQNVDTVLTAASKRCTHHSVTVAHNFEK